MSKKLTPKETFDKNIDKINEILTYQNEYKQSYGDKGGDTIKAAVETMRVQTLTAFKDGKVDISDEDKSRVNAALNVMLDIILYKPIVNMTRDLSLEVSKLAFNWNQWAGVKDIERSSRLLERLVQAQKTLDDTILVAGKVIDRMNRELTRRPVAYELSKHYLESLKVTKPT